GGGGGAHRAAGLELAVREVGRTNRTLEVVLQAVGRRPVATAALAVALGTLGLGVEGLAAPQQLRRCLRCGRERDGGLDGVLLPALRQALDVRDHRDALLVRDLMPRGHRGPAHAARDRAEEIAVGRKAAARRRAELEDGCRKVARQWRKEGGGRAG